MYETQLRLSAFQPVMLGLLKTDRTLNVEKYHQILGHHVKQMIVMLTIQTSQWSQTCCQGIKIILGIEDNGLPRAWTWTSLKQGDKSCSQHPQKRNVLQEAWKTFPEDLLKKFPRSLLKRVPAVLKNKSVNCTNSVFAFLLHDSVQFFNLLCVSLVKHRETKGSLRLLHSAV